MFNQLKSAWQATSRGVTRVTGWTLQGLRVLLVLSVLLYAAGMVWLVFFAGKVKIDPHSVLVLSLQGPLVEESAASAEGLSICAAGTP